MDKRPLLYDVFSKAGGATRGYQMAGFRVIGIDHEPQPHHCGDGFLQMDAFDFFDAYLRGEFEPAAAFHASPPCQGYSIMRNLPWLRGKEYPMLLTPVREALNLIGLPYVIENVNGARYRPAGVKGALPDGLQAAYLCGGMFGLPFYRHRRFETPFFWTQPGHPKHRQRIRSGASLGGRARDIVFSDTETQHESWPGRRLGQEVVSSPSGISAWAANNGAYYGHAKGVKRAALAMGIDWMNGDELSQAIPPVFTQYVGGFLMAEVLSHGR